MEQGIRLLDDLDSPRGASSGDDELNLPKRRRPSYCAQIRHISKRCFLSLVPTYIQPAPSTTKKELHPTAYLDALRGYAALIVFFYNSFPMPDLWLFQQPYFFRVLFRGGPDMVAVFFIISGYVLSYRLLKWMHNKETTRLLDALASSTFRRWLRLHGSTGVATLVAMVLTRLGWFEPHATNRKDTLHEQFWDWFTDLLYASDPFTHVNGWIRGGAFTTRYLWQMWTIPVEHRGSIVLFVFCAAACKLSVRSRWIFLWVVVCLSYYWRAVYVAEFLMGMFVADLSLCRHPERLAKLQLPPLGNMEKSPAGRWHTLTVKIGCVTKLLLGIFLLSQPDDPDTNPDVPFPWTYLLWLAPSWYGEALYTFWTSIGALMLILALDNYPTLQIPFNWSFSQYLGQLSFGIYCMHVIVLESLFKPILNPWREEHLGQGYLACFAVEATATMCVLWMADYFTRADELVVRFGRRLEARTFQK